MGPNSGFGAFLAHSKRIDPDGNKKPNLAEGIKDSGTAMEKGLCLLVVAVTLFIAIPKALGLF